MATTPAPAAKPAAAAPAATPGFSFFKFILSVGLGAVGMYAYMNGPALKREIESLRAQLGGGSGSPPPAQIPAQVPTSAPVVTGVTQAISNTRAGATSVRAGDAIDVTPSASGAGSAAVEYQTLVTLPNGSVQSACGWVSGACRVTLNSEGTYVIRTESRVVGAATAQATSAPDTVVVVTAGAGRLRLAATDVAPRGGLRR